MDITPYVQTLDQVSCAKRHILLSAEFGGLNVPPLELDDEPARYTSFTATLGKLTLNYESEAPVGGAAAAAPERVRSQARRHLPLPPRGGR
jgi:hypothetical protein